MPIAVGYACGSTPAVVFCLATALARPEDS
jgi:hypothetical protein